MMAGNYDYSYNYNHNYNNVSMKKRKELDVDDISDELHDFSLSSQARKIRRLNGQLPPIIEEEREQELLPVTVESSGSGTDNAMAMVLYRPPSQTHSSPNLSVSLDLISGFKNQFIRAGQPGEVVGEDDKLPKENVAAKNNHMAVVPWVPSQFPHLPTQGPGVDDFQTEVTELMEGDDMDEETMDIEETNNPSIEQVCANGFDGVRESDGINQWQQKHCVVARLPEITSTPISWFQ